MPTQRKTGSSAKKTAKKSSGAKSSAKSGSKSRKGSSSASTSRGSQSRSGAKTQGSSGTGAKSGRKQSQGRGGSAKRASSSRRGKAPNAVELLTQDHRNVQKMFRKAQKMESGDRELQEIVEMTCAALTQHAELEEQLFYPALREGGQNQDLVAEAQIEHDSAKQLIAQLEALGPRDERYKAMFKVLGEYVNHHIEEEETQIFRAAKRAKIDMEALGEQMLMRKQGSEGGEDSGGMSGAGGAKASGSRGATKSGGSRGQAGARAGSRSSAGTAGSAGMGGDGGLGEADDESEAEPMSSRSSGDSADDSERPGRGGRNARGQGSGDDSEIDIETPGSPRSGSH
ncbi:MAG: hemerythrin domain-containing protein [Pseudomonadota bacterium]|nr:hemerythrin domain-containing protein [Pseudomonadota bacterium]